MSKRQTPVLAAVRPAMGVRSYISPAALARWNPGVHAAADDDNSADRTIGIYDVIGEDWWTGGGFTAKRMSAALRALGKGPVTVFINSPGGDMFEGSAIYSMMREHDGDITVKVMGVAASAASIIAMGGDNIQIARVGFFMIHNCWVIAEGNRNDLKDIAETLEPFDSAMADVYAARTGDDIKAIQKMMDRESWIGGSAAVEQGFADALLASDEIAEDSARAPAAAVRKLEAALRAGGIPKAEAMRLISELKSSVGATSAAGGGGGDPAGRGASDSPALAERLKSFSLSIPNT